MSEDTAYDAPDVTVQKTTLYVVRCGTCRDLIGSSPEWQEAERVKAEHVEAHRDRS